MNTQIRTLNVSAVGDNITRFSLLTKKDSCHNFIIDNAYSNAAFRAAYFLYVMRGANDLKSISTYSKHMDEYSDNGISLRGALGPRLINWIGADQLQEAININIDVDEKEDYIKPVGVNQLKSVYDDLKHGMNESSVIFRDPAVDFEITNDVPNLMSILFVNGNTKLSVFCNYSQIEYGSNYINELWVFLHIAQLFKIWLEFEELEFNVVSPICNNDEHINLVITEESQIIQGPVEFWTDIDVMQDFQRHLRCMINEKSFESPEVAIGICVEKIDEVILQRVKSNYLCDLGIVMLLSLLVNYDPIAYEDIILEYFNKMSTAFKNEIAGLMLEKISFSFIEQDKLQQLLV